MFGGSAVRDALCPSMKQHQWRGDSSCMWQPCRALFMANREILMSSPGEGLRHGR